MNAFFKSEADYLTMSLDGKIGLVATVDDEGEPHITFLSSIQPFGDDMMTVGEFCSGLSKRFFTERPKAGFLILSPSMEIWHGRINYAKTQTTGAEFEMYNNKPLFRYNSYCGVGKVHYFNLHSLSSKLKLNMGALIPSAIISRLLALVKMGKSPKILPPQAKQLFDDIGGLKFISYLDGEGYPVITPVIQAAPAGRGRIVFAGFPFKKEVGYIPKSVKAAILAVNLKTESVLVKGRYCGKGIKHMDIERVYNSMPPIPGYIYPPEELKKVEVF
ncbi:MAG: pyridoxamine 5'-phosphate oxidase family protein [Clostridia bacterium]